MFVDNSITKDDLVYIKKLLDEGQVQPLRENPTYEDEVEFIRAVQNTVLNLVPNKNPLPYFRPREPKDIYKAKGKYGACCDRSRLIEKILRKHRFKTRHVFIFKCSRERESHAVSEICTKNGWLVVDSNSNWVSLDENNNPHSMKHIIYGSQIMWEKPMCSQIGRSDMKDFCEGSSYFFYGVYSFSGKLYPPFIYRWPNINLREFTNIDNLKHVLCYLKDWCQNFRSI